jgi:hypothetical protein
MALMTAGGGAPDWAPLVRRWRLIAPALANLLTFLLVSLLLLLLAASPRGAQAQQAVNVVNAPAISSPIVTAINELRALLVGGSDSMSVAQAVDRLRASNSAGQKLMQEAVTQSQTIEGDRRSAARRREQAEEDARRYQLPPDPCSTAEVGATVGALPGGVSGAVARGAGGGNPRAGGGVGAGNVQVRRALGEQSAVGAPAPEVARARTVEAHGEFCTDEERSKLPAGYCAGPSGLPNAPALASNLYDKLTLNQRELDAASLFIRNAISPEPPRALTRREYSSDEGRAYFALQKQIETALNLAAEPMNRTRVDRAGHRVLLQQSDARARAAGQQLEALLAALRSLDGSGAQALTPILQRAATQDGVSFAEVMAFEVNRRYGNLAWMREIAAATPEALAREQLMVSALQLRFMHDMTQRLDRLEGLGGAQLASLVRTEFQPKLDAQLAAIRGAGR